MPPRGKRKEDCRKKKLQVNFSIVFLFVEETSKAEYLLIFVFFVYYTLARRFRI